MFGCFEVITIWKKSFNPDSKKEEFTRCVLPVLCKWRSRVNRTAAESGAIDKRYATVIIPCEDNYIFDGRNGDYIALGAHEVEITGEKPYRVSDVKELLKPDFFQIEYIKDVTNSKFGKHYRIEGIL